MVEFYSAVHTIIAELIYAENFFIALYDETNTHLSFPYFKDIASDITHKEVEGLAAEVLDQTLTGYMLKKGELLHADAKLMKELTEKGEINEVGEESKQWVGVPLKKDSRILGAMVVQSYDEQYGYTVSDIDLLRFVAHHLANVIDRKNAKEALMKTQAELENRVEERTTDLAKANRDLESEISERRRAEHLMQTLYQIAVLANDSTDFQKFYSRLHRILNKLIDAKNLYIVTQTEDGKSLHFPYYQNEFYNSPMEQPHLIQQLEMEHISSVIAGSRSRRFTHDEKKPDSKEKQPMFSSWLGVPLKNEFHQTAGVLATLRYNIDDDFKDDDQNLLSYVAQQIASSLQRQHQSQALVQAHDELQTANNQLEQRVMERTKLLLEANEELQDNIDERMKIEEKLAFDAFHDNLTQLPNRALFLDRLEQAVSSRKRDPQEKFAVLFLDLDRFKVINDSLGHHIGDLLLIEISKRLSKCIRPGDTVARLGGDEFAILLLDLDIKDAAGIVADRISDSLIESFDLEGNMVFISTSIGINLCETEINQSSDILRDADTAMYQAKSKGKAQHAFFDESMYQEAVLQLRLESELRRALEKNQILVYYQPIISLHNQQVIAFEALARWNHPVMGWISPAQFIPIAEETGLISDIGLFILDRALEQTKIWQDSDPRLENLMISVNLSSHQLAQLDLYENSMQVIESHNFPVEKLRLEVTESLLIDNFETAKSILNKYEQAGIKILLDDFGTGYSSLSYLHHFPIHVLKVDRSFVMEMDKREENKAIIKTIKTLASSLNMEVVAEGIEEIEQCNTLAEMGFEYGQGYYFAKPLPPEEAKLYLIQKLS